MICIMVKWTNRQPATITTTNEYRQSYSCNSMRKKGRRRIGKRRERENEKEAKNLGLGATSAE
jgi:hypothetical protein